MTQITRRDFTKQTLGTITTYTLLEMLGNNDLFADELKPVTTRWLTDVNELGIDVKEQRISQIAWQNKVEELFSQVELPELLQLLDFDRLTKNLKMVDKGARSIRFKFPKVEGLPNDYIFGKQIFAIKKGRSVVPHGHNNMATAFLIIGGELRGRLYDRVEDYKENIIIKPTIDETFNVGQVSSISDYKDNIHWFQGNTEPSYIFNIHVLNVRPGSVIPTGRVYVDPNGEKLKGGLISAPRLGYKEAHNLYG